MFDTDIQFKEQRVAQTSLILGILTMAGVYNYGIYNQDLILESTVLLILSAAIVIFVLINRLRIFLTLSFGMLVFSTINLGLLLGGTIGLGTNSPQVVEGLSRLTLAILTVWVSTADMRHMKLTIEPFAKKRNFFVNSIYGILYPPKELWRLIKSIILIFLAFYFVTSGIDLISTADVDNVFFQRTERLVTNVLFVGIQAPLMMSSRASISRTFSEYLQNLSWAETLINASLGSSPRAYSEILKSSAISYDQINSNGKHVWISVFMIVLLQAFQAQIIALNLLENFNYQSIISALRALVPI